MTSKGKLLASLFIVLLLVPATFYIGKGESDANEVTFPLNITVKTPKGDLEERFKIFIYRLDWDETRLVKSIEGAWGDTTVQLTVRKVEYRPVSESIRTLMKGNVYRTINFRVVVFGLEGSQSLHIPIDPAEIEATGKKDVVLVEKPYPEGRVLTQQDLSYVVLELVAWDEKWKLTHIVTWHSWDTIDTYFIAEVGSKVAVATQYRVSTRNGHPPNEEWGPVTIVLDWHEAGENVVTIESPRRSPGEGWWTADERHEIYFGLKYRYERWREWMAAYWEYDEYVFVVDTPSDPQGHDTIHGSLLDGNGVSDPWNHGEYKYGPPGDSFGFPVKGHGGEALRWRVSVGFGVSWPPGVSVSVSLAVWKELQDPSPMYVYVYPHTPPPGHPDYKGYIYDDNTKQMKLYLTWAPLPP